MKKVHNVENYIKSLKKQLGSDAVTVLKDPKYPSTILDGISTQCLSLDLAIGRPGVPVGRITHIFGLDGSSKSTLGTHLLAEVQYRGGVGILFDTESGYDNIRSKKIGVNIENLITLVPEDMETAFDYIEKTVIKLRKKIDQEVPLIIVLDSIAAIPTKLEKKKSFGDKTIASHAMAISAGFRQLTGLLAKERVALVLINQLRNKIDSWGTHQIPFGGLGIRYYDSLRIQVTKTDVEYADENDPIGIWVKSKIPKSKIARPFKQANYLVNFDNGFDHYLDLKECGLKLGVIEKRGGGWVKIGKDKVSKSKWPKYVDTKLNGWRNFHHALLEVAIKKGLIKPYGVE